MQQFLFKLLAQVPIDTSPLPKAGLDASGNPSTTLMTDVLNVIFGILAAIAFVSVVYGGFKYVISQGDPTKTAKAKDIIMYSIIGLVISLSAFGIVNLFLQVII